MNKYFGEVTNLPQCKQIQFNSIMPANAIIPTIVPYCERHINKPEEKDIDTFLYHMRLKTIVNGKRGTLPSHLNLKRFTVSITAVS